MSRKAGAGDGTHSFPVSAGCGNRGPLALGERQGFLWLWRDKGGRSIGEASLLGREGVNQAPP